MLTRVIIFTTILSLLIFFNPLDVKADSLKASIWAPSKVLAEQQYHGMLVVDDNLESDTTFDVVTDNEQVVHVLTESVLIPKGKHHGIITFETRGTGNAKIYAIHKDNLLEQTIQVVESADTPTKIDLIMPSSLVGVSSNDNGRKTGYVFLLNSFGNPVVTQQPIMITLTGNGDVILPENSVTINSGNHYAKFIFETKGSGTITATASNLEPSNADISVSEPNKIELHLEVAPNPIPTGSSAEVYYWLERGGKPYLPSHDVKITITIDKGTNLSFDGAMKGAAVLTASTSDKKTTDSNAKKIITRSDAQITLDSTRKFILQKGTYYGRATVYATFDEKGDININGLAESINPKKDEEIIKTTDTLNVNTEKSSHDKAVKTKVFALPDPAYDKIEIIVSSQSDNGLSLEQHDEDFTVFADNKLALNASSGKIKGEENYGILVANAKDIGTSKIFAQRSEVKGDEKEIQIKTKYVKDPEIKIVPLPIIFGATQDLFLISSSHDKIITNPNSTNNENLISITSRPAFDYQVIHDNPAVITIRGTITDLLQEDPVVHVASNAFTATDTLKVYNPNRNKIESLHPNIVYAGEPFPIVNHVTDLDNNPLRKAELRVSSGVEMGTMGDLVYFNQSGTHGIIFYDKNTVPVESTITIKGGDIQSTLQQQVQQQIVERKPTVFSYDVSVTNGKGSGRYQEGQNVTISAPATIGDTFILKKKLVGWENLPYKEPTATFQIDSDIKTKPIYQDDYTFVIAIVAGVGGIVGGVFYLKKYKKRSPKDETKSDEEKAIDEILES